MDESIWTNLLEVAQNKEYPKEFRATLASFMELCDRKQDSKLLLALSDITNLFTILFNGMQKEEDISGDIIEPIPNLKLGKGQHVLLITIDDNEAAQIAKQIATNHKNDGVLAFNTSSKYANWLEKEVNSLSNDSIRIFQFPMDETVIDAEGKFSKEKAEKIVFNSLGPLFKDNEFVLGVTLTSSENLMKMINLNWDSYLVFEENGNRTIENKPLSWICLYSLQELHAINNIKKLSLILQRTVFAHHVAMIRVKDGELLRNAGTITRCYEYVLAHHMRELQLLDDIPAPQWYVESIIKELDIIEKNYRNQQKNKPALLFKQLRNALANAQKKNQIKIPSVGSKSLFKRAYESLYDQRAKTTVEQLISHGPSVPPDVLRVEDNDIVTDLMVQYSYDGAVTKVVSEFTFKKMTKLCEKSLFLKNAANVLIKKYHEGTFDGAYLEEVPLKFITFRNRFALILFGGKPFLTDSKDVANTLADIFKYLWKISEPYKELKLKN